MKFQVKALIIILVLITFQCVDDKNKSELTTKIEGKIQGVNLKNLYLLNHFGDTINTIVVNPNANFDLKLKDFEEGYFTLLYGEEKSNIYLATGDSLYLNLSADELKISGHGAERNNYLIRKHSPEFNWYSNYYKTGQKGNQMVYYHNHYFKTLKEKLFELSDESKFVKNESKELEYELANWLLVNQFSLENTKVNDSIAEELTWAKSFNIDDNDAINNSKNYISLVSKILISQNRFDHSVLNDYYNRINHPSFKTHFLLNLITPLHKELQFGEDDYKKSKTVESFINNQQPSDSIGFHIFNLYDKFHKAEGKIASFLYENINGKMVSLEDFRGKFVYIDFWATWCAPCLAEIPYLKKLEERFKNDKIEFIGISIDKLNAKEKWKKMVVQKELSNTQLFAPSQGYQEKVNITDEFMKLTYVNSYYLGIPHFLLIDPEGKIIDTYTYRPSNKKTKENISKLLENL